MLYSPRVNHSADNEASVCNSNTFCVFMHVSEFTHPGAEQQKVWPAQEAGVGVLEACCIHIVH